MKWGKGRNISNGLRAHLPFYGHNLFFSSSYNNRIKRRRICCAVPERSMLRHASSNVSFRFDCCWFPSSSSVKCISYGITRKIPIMLCAVLLCIEYNKSIENKLGTRHGRHQKDAAQASRRARDRPNTLTYRSNRLRWINFSSSLCLCGSRVSIADVCSFLFLFFSVIFFSLILFSVHWMAFSLEYFDRSSQHFMTSCSSCTSCAASALAAAAWCHIRFVWRRIHTHTRSQWQSGARTKTFVSKLIGCDPVRDASELHFTR